MIVGIERERAASSENGKLKTEDGNLKARSSDLGSPSGYQVPVFGSRRCRSMPTMPLDLPPSGGLILPRM
jgi:hypothetical protein